MITYRFGRIFPVTFIFIGVALSIVSIYAIKESYGLSLLLVFISCPMFFASYGVQIDLKKRLFREYSNYIGYCSGNWKSIDDYKYLCILAFNQVTLGQSRGNSTQLKDKLYHICLLTDNHFKRQTIFKSESLNEVKEKSNTLADLLQKDIVSYSPKAKSRKK